MTELPSSVPRLQGELMARDADRFGKDQMRGQSASALRYLTTLLVMIASSISAGARQSPSPQSGRADDYTINVNVDMVVLHATTHDQRGAFVSGLDKEAFQVYEDGTLQQIKYFSHEDIPVTVGLVVDNSGSMRPKRPDVVAAALAFARSSNPQDQMFVINFNEKVSFGLPDRTLFTHQVAELEVALSRITADGETALYDAIAAALDHLKRGDRDKRVLVVISDGGDNASKHSLSQILTMAGQRDAIIYTIGSFDEQDDDRNPDVLKRLAKSTGGEAFLPESTKDIVPICERVARDIRNQYTLAYVPTNRKRDGTYRVIQVKVSAPSRGHLSVRTRTGYIAPPALPSPVAKTLDHENHN